MDHFGLSPFTPVPQGVKDTGVQLSIHMSAKNLDPRTLPFCRVLYFVTLNHLNPKPAKPAPDFNMPDISQGLDDHEKLAVRLDEAWDTCDTFTCLGAHVYMGVSNSRCPPIYIYIQIDSNPCYGDPQGAPRTFGTCRVGKV